MTIWQIILIICGIITAIVFILTFLALLIDDKKFKEREWWMLPATLIIIPIVIIGEMMALQEYLSDVWKDGGFRKHYQLKRERKAEYEA
jgi:NADH:ubiquinone oxidoreductase subunit 6 (subunit J)